MFNRIAAAMGGGGVMVTPMQAMQVELMRYKAIPVLDPSSNMIAA